MSAHALAPPTHVSRTLTSRMRYGLLRKAHARCGRITHADTPFYMTRLAVIDDLIADHELHLLRICPLAWVTAERETKFLNMPTAFGPISLRWQLMDRERRCG